jgi:hypothetical protein
MKRSAVYAGLLGGGLERLTGDQGGEGFTLLGGESFREGF